MNADVSVTSKTMTVILIVKQLTRQNIKKKNSSDALQNTCHTANKYSTVNYNHRTQWRANRTPPLTRDNACNMSTIGTRYVRKV